MKLGQSSLQFRSILFVLGGWLLSGRALSLEWDGRFAIAPTILYTDNACLTKDNKKDDFTGIATATPFGSVRAQTSRTTFFASGHVSVNTLTDGDLRDNGCTGTDLENRQKWFPSLRSNLNTVLIGSWAKFDARLKVDQNDVNSSRASSNDGLDRNGNTNTYYRYSLSPYMSRKVGGGGTYNLRYTFSQILNTADTVSDSSRHAVTTSLNSDRSAQLTGGLTGRFSRTSYSDDVVNINTGVATPREDTELKSASLNLAYQFGRSWQINGTMGWEWNDIQTFNDSDTGGSAWDIGVRWTPSPRTTVSVGSGDRFFGSTPRVNFSHSRKRSVITGSYRKRITFQRDLSTGDLGSTDGSGFSTGSDDLFSDNGSTFDQVDENGEPFDDLGVNSSLNSNSAILDERFILRYSYTHRSGKFGAWGTYSKQTRADDGAQADFLDWQLAFTPSLSRKYSLTGSIGFEEVRPAGFTQSSFDFDNYVESENWTYRLNYTRPLNTRLNLTLDYRFTDRRSDAPTNEYQENLVTATLNISL